MLLDIHTHHKEGIPGENILNVEPGLFEPAEGCYYSIGIHPWKVLETEPEDWKRLEDAAGHPSVLAIGEAGLDKLASADTFPPRRNKCLLASADRQYSNYYGNRVPPRASAADTAFSTQSAH